MRDNRQTIASLGQIARLNRGGNARPIEIDHGRERLGPGGDRPKGGVDFRPVCDEAVLVKQVARKLGETIAISVTAKGCPKCNPKICVAGSGIHACPVLQADGHHAANLQAKQT